MDTGINTIVFDLGGVLIDWQPSYVYLKEFRGNQKQMDHFLNHICSWEWNLNQDAGYPLALATQERIALFPQHKKLIEMYYGRWEEMLGFAHLDTLALLTYFKTQTDFRLLALTNWSHETFPIAQEKFPWLSWFEGILVSGAEGIRKPDPKIYELLTERYTLDPSKCVFIDDNQANVTAANQLGFQGIHFKDAVALHAQLEALGVHVEKEFTP
ncbi:HAD family phosphatase [Flavobacteriaceae bacterium]|nr:HAD family phosphatase [Flavobacteriaceae bacterium]